MLVNMHIQVHTVNFTGFVCCMCCFF